MLLLGGYLIINFLNIVYLASSFFYTPKDSFLLIFSTLLFTTVLALSSLTLFFFSLSEPKLAGKVRDFTLYLSVLWFWVSLAVLLSAVLVGAFQSSNFFLWASVIYSAVNILGFIALLISSVVLSFLKLKEEKDLEKAKLKDAMVPV
jgi:hypothetical protein